MVGKNRGSSLLATLIFAFILMIVISALAYNFKVNSLAINTLVDEKKTKVFMKDILVILLEPWIYQFLQMKI